MDVASVAGEGLSNHELTIYLISGLATLVGGLACVMLSWLRTDIRNIAKAILSLKNEHSDLTRKVEHLEGRLEGKGLI